MPSTKPQHPSTPEDNLFQPPADPVSSTKYDIFSEEELMDHLRRNKDREQQAYRFRNSVPT